MQHKTLQEIIDGLNEQQKSAVLNITGPELIIAGAGSGKTTVLTARTALIMNMGILPERILALTFTKKAADEMKQRIVALQGPEAQRLCMGTFHSVFIQFIRPYAQYIGFPNNFTILDKEDSLSCIKRCIDAIILGDINRKLQEAADRPEECIKLEKQKKTLEAQYKPKEIQTMISACKNRMISAEIYAASKGYYRKPCSPQDMEILMEISEQNIAKDIRNNKPDFWKIFLGYNDLCKRSGMMDFDDILLYTYELFNEYPQAKESIASRFDYIMVDEFQDTNRVQNEILNQLTEHNNNICVVGDDSQSIYAFRGAEIKNIMSFKENHPGCLIIKLEKNYRSTSQIVDCANRLISHNENRIPKTCVSNTQDTGKIIFRETENEKDEAEYVANVIAYNVKHGNYDYKDCAILFRTNSQSRILEDMLVRRNIPYVIYSGTSFFDRMEVKDLMAYFKLSVNPSDDESFRRIINKPVRGIGEEAMKRITGMADYYNIPLWNAIHHPAMISLNLSKRTMEGIGEFKTMMYDFITDATGKNAYEMAVKISDTVGFLKDYSESKDEESLKRADNLRELLDSIKAYEEDLEAQNKELPEEQKTINRLAGYLQTTMLLSNADTDTGNDNKVSLMTVHCSKGLEFKTVIVTGMEKGLFPLEIEKSQFEEEEERRLFYVATTRAKRNLHLTMAKSRIRMGQRKPMRQSAFIEEFLGENSNS